MKMLLLIGLKKTIFDRFQFMLLIHQQKYSRKQFEKLLSGVKF